MINLTYVDYKPLTGLQGRGVLRASALLSSGIIKQYRSGLHIEVPTLQPSTISISSGALVVDTAFVENTETLIVTTTADGTFKLVCEVNLNNNNATFKLVTTITSQDNLTSSNTGIHQMELANVVRTGGVITSFELTAPIIDENIIDYLNSNYYTKSETYSKSQANSLFPTKSDVWGKAYSDARYAFKDDVYTKSQSNNLYPTKSDVWGKEYSDARYQMVSDTRREREYLIFDGLTNLSSELNIYLPPGVKMNDFEDITMIFQRRNTSTGARVDTGFHQYNMRNFDGTGDGFIGKTNTVIFPLTLSAEDPKIVVKAWSLGETDSIMGTSEVNATNANYGLAVVWGTYKESYYYANIKKTSKALNLRVSQRDQILSQFDKILVEKAPIDKPIYMANQYECYDIYSLSDSEIEELKIELNGGE